MVRFPLVERVEEIPATGKKKPEPDTAAFLQREYSRPFLPERISLGGELIGTTGFEPAVVLCQ